MPTSSAGLLLLLVAALGLIGFLTGNLDRWLAFLFAPSRPPLSGAAAAPGALVSVGSTTPRVTT